MSSTAPVAAPAPSPTPVVHQSFWARAATTLSKIGHAIKVGFLKVVSETPKVAAAVNEVAPTVEAISEMIVPGSSIVERAAMDVFGHVVKAIADAGSSASTVTIQTPAGSLALDQQLVTDIQQLIPLIKGYLHPQASSTAPPSSVAPASAKA